MLQIKTVFEKEAEKFDKRVNAALIDGWHLMRRLSGPEGFVAEMEKVIITKAERGCDNCAHCDLDATQEPCVSCDDASRWEDGTR